MGCLMARAHKRLYSEIGIFVLRIPAVRYIARNVWVRGWASKKPTGAGKPSGIKKNAYGLGAGVGIFRSCAVNTCGRILRR